MNTYRLNLYAFFVLVLSAGSFACLDQIELKNQRFTDKATIIQGRLVLGKNAATANVSITQNGDFAGLEVGNFISGASVLLIDELGKSITLQEYTRDRNYSANIVMSDPNFTVKPGKRYQLQVKLRDGKIFESSFESLLEVPKQEKINFQTQILQFINFKGLVDRDTFMQYRLWTSTRPQINVSKALIRREIHMIYKFTDNARKICYCVEPQRVDKVFLYKGSDFSAERLDSFLFFENLWDHHFAEGCYIKFVQESLSPEAFEYWEQVKELSERTGSMFDPPAGKIKSNFSSKQAGSAQVFGYFYATQHDTLSIFISPQAAGKPRRYCPLPPVASTRPTPCDDCLLILDSSTTKPKFWPE
jgi:hypothetical protein